MSVALGWNNPNSGDLDVTLDLLYEYSAKLRNMTDTHQKDSQNLRLVLFTGALFLLGLIVLIIFLFNLGGFELSNIFLFITLATIVGLFYHYNRTQIHIELIKEDILIAKSQLEKVIRITSQIEEHQPLGLGIQLKLQLRLAESEGAIRLAENAVGTSHQFIDKRSNSNASHTDLPTGNNAS